MHERPLAKHLRKIVDNSFSSRSLGLSFEIDTKAVRDKDKGEQKSSQEEGGKQARLGSDIYDDGCHAPNNVSSELKHEGLFIKTAGLSFQNPKSGLGVERTSARRARYGESSEVTAFQSPRYLINSKKIHLVK